MKGDPPSVGEVVAGILGTFTVLADDDGLLLTCYACTPPREVEAEAPSHGLDEVVLAALDHARTVHPIRGGSLATR